MLFTSPFVTLVEPVGPPKRSCSTPTQNFRQNQILLEKAWESYNDSCPCGESFEFQGGNCAHYLSDALINGGFADLEGVPYCCKSSRPIRAKGVRNWFKDHRHSTLTKHPGEPTNGIALVYQQNGTDPSSQGHVVLRKYKNGKFVGYKGTLDRPKWIIQEYYY